MSAFAPGDIAAIGNLKDAGRKQTIDAHGKVVAPGFIDMLGQSELTMLVNPRVPSKIYQGITTEITGEGNSAAPLNPFIIAADRAGYEHLKHQPRLDHVPRIFHASRAPGHGHQPGQLCGCDQRAADGARRCRRPADRGATGRRCGRWLTRHAGWSGGLSSALQYAPAPYAKTDELIALASEAAKYGGIYATHMRSEGETRARGNR